MAETFHPHVGVVAEGKVSPAPYALRLAPLSTWHPIHGTLDTLPFRHGSKPQTLESQTLEPPNQKNQFLIQQPKF